MAWAKSTKSKRTVKGNGLDTNVGDTVICHMCDGAGLVPAEYYTKSRSSSKSKSRSSGKSKGKK